MENLQAVSNVTLKKVKGFDYSQYAEQYHIAVLLHLFQTSLNHIIITSTNEIILKIDTTDLIVSNQAPGLNDLLYRLLKVCFKLKQAKHKKDADSYRCVSCHLIDCRDAYCAVKTVGIRIERATLYHNGKMDITMPQSFLQKLAELQEIKTDHIIEEMTAAKRKTIKNSI